MSEATLIGIDLAKRVFQLHGSLGLKSRHARQVRNAMQAREYQSAEVPAEHAGKALHC
ncbi:hypothetical protein [Roseovarius sp. D0-M9]|uniref:hypothetical protein n=1 Tax=Roseovarius sp. D0-M9 TaxID=3127117 RepID=UPI00300FDF6B